MLTIEKHTHEVHIDFTTNTQLVNKTELYPHRQNFHFASSCTLVQRPDVPMVLQATYGAKLEFVVFERRLGETCAAQETARLVASHLKRSLLRKTELPLTCVFKLSTYIRQ